MLCNRNPGPALEVGEQFSRTFSTTSGLNAGLARRTKYTGESVSSTHDIVSLTAKLKDVLISGERNQVVL